jgi:hypothetical protein
MQLVSYSQEQANTSCVGELWGWRFLEEAIVTLSRVEVEHCLLSITGDGIKGYWDS